MQRKLKSIRYWKKNQKLLLGLKKKSFEKKKSLTLPGKNSAYVRKNFLAKKSLRSRKRFKQKGIGSRFTFIGSRWYKCKKPFWKRKSFKRIKLLSYFFLNIFKRNLPPVARNNSKLIEYKWQMQKPWQQRSLWFDYYRRNKLKYWFKNKILLRYYWLYRYSHWTHTKLQNTLKTYTTRKPMLLRFLQREELMLERFICWWGIITPRLRTLRRARILIYNGLIWVNFKPNYNYKYVVRPLDCIFYYIYSKLKTGDLPHVWIARRLMQYGKTKFYRGYFQLTTDNRRPTKIWKLLRQPETRIWLKKIKKFHFFIKKYLLLKNHKLKQHTQYFISYFSYFEKSYKYKIFIALNEYSWFIFLFSSFVDTIKINYKTVNTFVNFRYF